MARPALGLRSRGQTYGLLAGAVVLILIAGLVVPYLVGDEANEATLGSIDTGGGNDFAGGGDLAPVDATTDTTASPDVAAPGSPGTTPGGGPPRSGGGEDASASATDSGAPTGTPAVTSTTAAPAAGARLTASDRGVTPTTIKVGFLLLDVGGLGQVGIGVPGVDPEEERLAYEAFIAELNARGGIHGRKVEGVYRKYDVFNQDDMRAACLALTRDAKVFAVIDGGGFFGPPVLCITQENQTPLISTGGQGMPKEWYPRSQGRLFTVFMGGTRAMTNLAHEVARLGQLDGAKVGIVADLRPGQKETVDILEAALADLGHEVVHRTNLANDLQVGASQIPVEVQQMATKGVDRVFMVANTVYAAQWVQAAEAQRWQARYFVGDWQSGSTDTYAQSMPSSFEGSLAITVTRTNEHRVGKPETSGDATCRTTYEKGTKKRLERGSNQHGQYLRGCNLVKLLELAGTKAGPELTRPRLGSAMQSLGQIPVYNVGGSGSFTAAKPDAADYVRTMRWQFACRCWMPVDEFRKTRY